MWEATTTWHCSACDTQLSGEDVPCPLCTTQRQVVRLRAIVRRMLPYARLYEPPTDDEGYYADEIRRRDDIVRRAEQATGIKRPRAAKKKGQTMTKTVKAAFAIASITMLLPAMAAAQQYDQAFWDRLQLGTPVEGRPGCTWQWARDTVGPWGGWYHACAAPQPARAQQALPEAPASQAGAAKPCGAYNPYVDPSGMMACIAALPVPEPPPLQQIQAGRRYHLAYSSLQVHVLSVGTTLDGVQVVTYQWLADAGAHQAGDVGSCRNDGGGSHTTCLPFVPMGGQ
jgi:hypothetical protein